MNGAAAAWLFGPTTDDEPPAGVDPEGEPLFTNAALLPLTAWFVAACTVDACVAGVATAAAGDPLSAIAPARATLVAIFTDLFLNTSPFVSLDSIIEIWIQQCGARALKAWAEIKLLGWTVTCHAGPPSISWP